ncbi:hypothetical protein [Actinomadura hibisca]|uniref:hypothetical protein n=1 Tax=Actinomadura hibisca TaxID=68565 RepID=UPI0012F7BDD4|nr:hypothetical protein [Actinomadura hibisca]
MTTTGEYQGAHRAAAPEPEPVMTPRDRRVIQAVALASLVTLLLVLHWADESKSAQRLAPPQEKAIDVPKGDAGELAGAQWWQVNRLASKQPPAGGPADAAEMHVILSVRPKTATAAKTVSYGTTYKLRDTEGHVWSATGTAAPQTPGTPIRITVRAVVPRAKLRSLTLEVRPPADPARKGPRPLLRFAP